MEDTKLCKYCQSEIPQKARVCPHCKRTVKRNRGCLIAIIVFIVLICIGLSLSVTDEGGTSDTSTQQQNNDTSTQQQNSGYITMDEYNQIQFGMTYDEVVAIIGSGGELTSTVTSGDYTISMYSWYGGSFTGANANITFENGKVTGKAQIGLN